MILPIDNNWRITADTYSWRIEKSRTRNGRIEWQPCSWFTTLESTIRGLGDRMVRTSEAQTLAEALEVVKNVSAKLSQALTPRIGHKGGLGIMSNQKVIAMVDHAFEYAELGFQVFPVKPDQKTPLFKNWQKRATKDPKKISEWWGCRSPMANIGVVTGRPSGIVVVDVDVKGEKPGLESLTRLIEEYMLCETRTSRTGSGGKHLYYEQPELEIRNKVNLLPGIDIRGQGGYVVGAGSIVAGNPYEWIESRPLAKLSKEFIDLTTGSSKVVHSGRVAEGTRNNYLASVAGQLRASGLGRSKIETQLLEENLLLCDPPLDESEVRQIATSISRYTAGGSPKGYYFYWREFINSDRGPKNSTTRHVLLVLGTRMNQHGRSCYPTIQMLATEAKLSERCIRSNIKLAIEGKWIKRYSSQGRGAEMAKPRIYRDLAARTGGRGSKVPNRLAASQRTNTLSGTN